MNSCLKIPKQSKNKWVKARGGMLGIKYVSKKIKKSKIKKVKKSKYRNSKKIQKKQKQNQKGGVRFSPGNVFLISSHGATQFHKSRTIDMHRYPGVQLINLSKLGELQNAGDDSRHFELFKRHKDLVTDTTKTFDHIPQLKGRIRRYFEDPAHTKVDDIELSFKADFKVGIYNINGPNPFGKDGNTYSQLTEGDYYAWVQQIESLKNNSKPFVHKARAWVPPRLLKEAKYQYGPYGPYVDVKGPYESTMADLNNEAQTELNKRLYEWVRTNDKDVPFSAVYLSELLDFLIGLPNDIIDTRRSTFILQTCRGICFKEMKLGRAESQLEELVYHPGGIRTTDEQKEFQIKKLMIFTNRQLVTKIRAITRLGRIDMTDEFNNNFLRHKDTALVKFKKRRLIDFILKNNLQTHSKFDPPVGHPSSAFDVGFYRQTSDEVQKRALDLQRMTRRETADARAPKLPPSSSARAPKLPPSSRAVPAPTLPSAQYDVLEGWIEVGPMIRLGDFKADPLPPSQQGGKFRFKLKKRTKSKKSNKSRKRTNL